MLSRLMCLSCLFTLSTLLTLSTLTGCGRDEASLPITDAGSEKKTSILAVNPTAKTSKLTPQERATVAKDALFNELSTQLLAAMSSGGPAKAIEACRKKTCVAGSGLKSLTGCKAGAKRSQQRCQRRMRMQRLVWKEKIGKNQTDMSTDVDIFVEGQAHMSTSKLKLTELESLGDAAECLRTLAHPHRLRMIQMLLPG